MGRTNGWPWKSRSRSTAFKRNQEVTKMRLPSEYESSMTFRDEVITYQRVCVTDWLMGVGDLEKVCQGHWPSKGTKIHLPSEYESSMTFRDEVITYQRVCVTDWLMGVGDLEKVCQGHWPSKGTKMHLPSEYESSTTIRDAVIVHQREVWRTDKPTKANAICRKDVPTF